MRPSPGAILSASALAAALALAGCGAGTASGGPATPASANGTAAPSSTAGVQASGAGSPDAGSTLFADGASHVVSVAWDESAYADMIAAHEADGSKEWIQTDITIGGAGGAGGGMQRPQGMNDDGGVPPADAPPTDAGRGGVEADADAGVPAGGGPGGGGRGGNELKERFLASDAFQSLYDAAYADLYAQLYSSGTAASLLDGITAVAPSSDGLTEAELAEQADTLRRFIQERTDALKDQV